jgi:protein-disulfide isomerase
MAVARQTRQGGISTVRQLNIAGRPALGAEDAQLLIIEIASFECPYCRRHWIATMPALQQRYIETGKLRYIFVDVVVDPMHRHAQAAAEAAHCAHEQRRYAAFRDRIYRHQKAIAAAFLEAHADAIGLDVDEFRHCMASDRHRTQVEDDTALVRRLQVRGTPSFFWAQAEPGHTNVRLIRRLSGARPIEDFARQFDALYQRHRSPAGTLAEATR